MAITVNNLTVYTQNGTGTWKDYGGGGGSSTNSDVFLSGTSSQGRKVSNGIKGFSYEINATGADLNDTIILVRWATLAGVSALDTKNLSGVVIRLEDTSGNFADYSVDGGDTYKGGWRESVIDTNRTATNNPGIFLISSVRYIGIVWDETANVGGGDDNCFIDEILAWPSEGLTITGDTTDLVGDLLAFDEASLYGIFQTRSGIVYSLARLIITPGALDISSSDSTLVFENQSYYDGTREVSSFEFNGLQFNDTDALTLTRLNIAADSGSPLIPDTFEASDQFLCSGIINSDLSLETCTIRGFEADMRFGDSTQLINFTAFDGCDIVRSSGAVFTNCDFRNPVNISGSFYFNPIADITDCSFFGSSGDGLNQHGIYFDVESSGATYSFDGISFFDFAENFSTDAAIFNDSSGNLTINVVGGGTSPTFRNGIGASTTVVLSVALTFTGLVEDSEVRIYEAGTQNELAGVESSTTSFVYNYEGVDIGNQIDVRIFHLDYTPVYFLLSQSTALTLGASDASIPIQQIFDRNYNQGKTPA